MVLHGSTRRGHGRAAAAASAALHAAGPVPPLGSGSRALAAALDENHTLLNLEISGNGATEESVSKIQNALRRNKMRDSDAFGAGPAISESSNDQNVASL